MTRYVLYTQEWASLPFQVWDSQESELVATFSQGEDAEHYVSELNSR